MFFLTPHHLPLLYCLRRQRARERQQKLLAEFASRQKSFMETAMDVGKHNNYSSVATRITHFIWKSPQIKCSLAVKRFAAPFYRVFLLHLLHFIDLTWAFYCTAL